MGSINNRGVNNEFRKLLRLAGGIFLCDLSCFLYQDYKLPRKTESEDQLFSHPIPHVEICQPVQKNHIGRDWERRAAVFDLLYLGTFDVGLCRRRSPRDVNWVINWGQASATYTKQRK